MDQTNTQTVSIERVVQHNRVPEICVVNPLSPIRTTMNLTAPTTIYRKKNSHNITRNKNKRKKHKKRSKSRKSLYSIDLDDSSGFVGPKRYKGESPLPKPPPRKCSIHSISSNSRTSSTISNIIISPQCLFTASQPPVENIYVFDSNQVHNFVHSGGLAASV